MNQYQTTLWNDLMALADESEAFYFSDQQMGATTDWYRIFNYRLAKYTEFIKPNATECRGHMFRISEEGYNAHPLALVSLPMEKFWNLYETPATMNLALNTISQIWDKMDGSLISTYLSSSDMLYLKSKGSLNSDQAMDSMKWLAQNPELYNKLHAWAKSGYTVNLEFCSPDNRIVIGYNEPKLIVLNARDNIDGGYASHGILVDSFGEYVVKAHSVDNISEFIDNIPEMQGIEGFVLSAHEGQNIMTNGLENTLMDENGLSIKIVPVQRVKVKTAWYLALHHTKDNINSPRRLFECVLEEATDDMRTLFHDDPLALKTIQEMEDFVAEKYNHMVDMVERFYERNKHLERKEYAIAGQEEFKGTFYFSLAMNKFIGRDNDYKNFLKGKWKQLGLNDKEASDE